MARIGADVEQLGTLAETFTTSSRELGRSRRTMTVAVADVGWHGPDADRFRESWANDHSPALRRIAEVLRQLSTDVRTQVDQQRTASEAEAPPPGPTTHLTTTPSGDPADLDGDGTVDDLEREWTDRRNAGERIGPPQLHLDEGGSIPQGLGHDPLRDQILTSYNNDDGVRLSIQDQHTGVEIENVTLGGFDGEPPVSSPTKGGGVATDGTYVWLADSDHVYVYLRTDIEGAAPGATVPAIGAQPVPAGSWITAHGDKVYVGNFKNPDYLFSYEGDPKMYRYDVGTNGALTNESDAQDIPYSVQGATVTDDGVVFSRSFSDQPVISPHDLTFQEFEGSLPDFNLEPAEDASKVYDLPHFSEGIAEVDGDIWVLSEGGADKFDGEGEQWIQIVPFGDLENLDGDGGVGPTLDLPGRGELRVPLPDELPDQVNRYVDLAKQIPGAVDEIKDDLADLGGDIKDGVEEFGGEVKDGVEDVGDGFKDGLIDLGNGIGGLL